jgi:hypothetical protein
MTRVTNQKKSEIFHKNPFINARKAEKRSKISYPLVGWYASRLVSGETKPQTFFAKAY